MSKDYFLSCLCLMILNIAVAQNTNSVDTGDNQFLTDITIADGVGGYTFKRLYTSVGTSNPDIYYEQGRKYRGQLKGLVPHGKGEILYENYKVVDPNIGTSIVAPMIIEGEFDNGKFVKATRLRTSAFSGMFVEGHITAGLRKHVPFWYVSNGSLNVWEYRDAMNNPVSEVRTIFKSNPGGSCYNGMFHGSGTWYCNQTAYSSLYGGEIRVLKIDQGFVTDSVELIIPHLNYRKWFSVINNPRKYLRLDLLEDYIEIYYTTGKVPGGNWNTATGAYVVKPPPPAPKAFSNTEALMAVAKMVKADLSKSKSRGRVISEGAVLSDNYLTTGYTMGDYLDYGEGLMLLVFALKGASIEVEGPNGKCNSEYAAPVQVRIFQCAFTNEQQFKSFYAFKTKFFQPGTDIYFVLYKFSAK